MQRIDSSMAVTLKDQVKKSLRKEISKNNYRPGDRLPPELDLAKHFGVNRHTARKAILELVKEGLLHRRVSRGTFVLSNTAGKVSSEGITVISENEKSSPGTGELHEQIFGGIDEGNLTQYHRRSGSSKTHITLSMWHNSFDTEIRLYRELPHLVRRKLPKTKLDIIFYPSGLNYLDSIVSQLARKVGPDLIMLEANNFPLFHEDSRLMSLNRFVEKDNYSGFVDGLFPKIRERFTIDGDLYVLPRDIAPVACLFYNKDLFDDAGLTYPDLGWDWSNLLNAASRLTVRRRGKTVRYGFTGITWLSFVYGNGGRIVDDVNSPTKSTFDEAVTMEGLKFYHDMINLYRVTPSPKELEISGDRNKMFIEGKTAMYLYSAFLIPFFKKTVKDFKWSFTLFPKSSKSNKQRFYSGGSGFGINKETKYPEEAWKVLKLLTGVEAQISFAKKRFLQPSHIKTAENYWGKEGKFPESIFNSVADQITFFPRSRRAALILNIISNESNSYFNDRQTIEKTVKRISNGVSEALQP